jgi:hypothetical protein
MTATASLSKTKKTKPPLGQMRVTDGLHFVRDAGERDRHPMRFVVGQHRRQGFPRNPALPRYAESLERGISLMGYYSRRAMEAQPVLSATYSVQMLPDPSEPKVKKPRKPRAPIRQMRWTTARFVCTHPVNRIAQAWLCVKDKGAGTGRAKADGTHTIDELPHKRGDYAVMSRGEVLRKRGVPLVFDLTEAASKVDALFFAAPAEERTWRGTSRVYANEQYEVHFDPSETEVGRFDEIGGNGTYKPFNLFMPEFSQKVRDGRGVIQRFRSLEGAIRKADAMAADRKRRTRG